jgi:hypothetical protein
MTPVERVGAPSRTLSRRRPRGANSTPTCMFASEDPIINCWPGSGVGWIGTRIRYALAFLGAPTLMLARPFSA